MTNNLLEKFKKEILETYNKLSIISKDIEKNMINVTSKEQRLNWGAKAMEMQSLKIRFIELAKIIKDDLETPLTEVSKEVDELYTIHILNTTPIQDSDTEEVKKIKEYLQTLKN